MFSSKVIPNVRSSLVILYTMIMALFAMPSVLIDPSGRLYTAIARYLWGKVLVKIAGIRLKVITASDIDWNRIYVVTANHASQMDIPSLFSGLEMPIRFMAKKSLFYIPVFGWSMWAANFIPVSRSSGKKARRSVDAAAGKIKKGPSLMVFPEGTRTPDGEIQKFKSGAFILAIKAQTPILPVAIRGSYKILPKDTMKMTPGPIELIIGKPIFTDNMTIADKEALKSTVQSRIIQMVKTGEPV
jgi:1-acyl-sn-glycerol-3-phosphate acyltransferase